MMVNSISTKGGVDDNGVGDDCWNIVAVDILYTCCCGKICDKQFIQTEYGS